MKGRRDSAEKDAVADQRRERAGLLSCVCGEGGQRESGKAFWRRQRLSWVWRVIPGFHYAGVSLAGFAKYRARMSNRQLVWLKQKAHRRETLRLLRGVHG